MKRQYEYGTDTSHDTIADAGQMMSDIVTFLSDEEEEILIWGSYKMIFEAHNRVKMHR